MHGEKAIALLREAKRNPKDLNPYDVCEVNKKKNC